MNDQRLKNLYTERRLLKELLRIDRERYSHLQNRIQEIKTIINSEFAPIPNSQIFFAIFDVELSQRISNFGTEYLKEILNENEEIYSGRDQ